MLSPAMCPHTSISHSAAFLSQFLKNQSPFAFFSSIHALSPRQSKRRLKPESPSRNRKVASAFLSLIPFWRTSHPLPFCKHLKYLLPLWSLSWSDR
jgi:hypothetical protein